MSLLVVYVLNIADGEKRYGMLGQGKYLLILYNLLQNYWIILHFRQSL